MLGEIPAIILSLLIIDVPFFGRKKTLIIFFSLAFILNLLCYYNAYLSLSLAMSRFCFREISTMIYAYTAEIYKTTYRSVGVGWGTGMGRLGTCIMPYLIFPLI